MYQRGEVEETWVRGEDTEGPGVRRRKEGTNLWCDSESLSEEWKLRGVSRNSGLWRGREEWNDFEEVQINSFRFFSVKMPFLSIITCIQKVFLNIYFMYIDNCATIYLLSIVRNDQR